jgi:hypothetical protein
VEGGRRGEEMRDLCPDDQFSPEMGGFIYAICPSQKGREFFAQKWGKFRKFCQI